MYSLIRKALFQLNPETAHDLTLKILKSSGYIPGFKPMLKSSFFYSNPVNVMGLNFPNRVGLAAGLDKNALVADVLSNLGFGFIEIGTVTPKGQPGNPKPRLFRIPKDKALVNRMGFNNLGVGAVVKNLKKYKNRMFILGGNIGKNTLTSNDDAVKDYLYVLENLYPWIDYIVLNVSCPNIVNLQKLQNTEDLRLIMSQMINFRKQQKDHKPFLVKLSPDLTMEAIDQTINLIWDLNFDGIIYSNTTISRIGLSIEKEVIDSIGPGGLSGTPLFTRNIERIPIIKQWLGDKALIGCGGIVTPDDAKRYFDAGADLVQLYTGFIYSGPRLVKNTSRLHV